MTQKSNVELKKQSYTCPECGTVHLFHELRMHDNGWDYSYDCKNCGDTMESNGTNYWMKKPLFTKNRK